MKSAPVSPLLLAFSLLTASQLGCGGDDKNLPDDSERAADAGKAAPRNDQLVGSLWTSAPENDCAYVLYFLTDFEYRWTFVCDKEPGVRYAEEVRAAYAKDGTAIAGDPVSSSCMLPPLYTHRFEYDGTAFVIQLREDKSVRVTRREASGTSASQEREVKMGCLSEEGSFTPTTQTYGL